MTAKADLPKLFNFDPKTPRIVGFGIGAWISFDTEFKSEVIAISTTLADPKTKKRTDKQLLIALNPIDALSLARTILEHAQKRGWKEPGQPEFVEYQISPTKKPN